LTDFLCLSVYVSLLYERHFYCINILTETTDTTFVETTFTAQPASSTIRSKPVTSTKRPQLATSTLKEQLVTVTSTATAELATSSPTEATTTIYATTYDTSDVSYAWENEGDYVLPTDIPTGISNFNIVKGVFAKIKDRKGRSQIE